MHEDTKSQGAHQWRAGCDSMSQDTNVQHHKGLLPTSAHVRWPSEGLAGATLLCSCIKATSWMHRNLKTDVPPPNKTQQSHASITVPSASGWRPCFVTMASSPFILSFSAVILLSGLPPVTATAARPPASPTPRCANTWLTDPITFFISLSFARCTGTSLSPEDRGKMATILLVEKMTGSLEDVHKWSLSAHTNTVAAKTPPPLPQQNQDYSKST